MAAHFGTAPFAFGSPTGNKINLLSWIWHVQRLPEEIKVCCKSGKIPFGLALDKFGKPTNDGAKAFEGIMLPFGGMKGAGISWMMDIIGGIFTGANHSGNSKKSIRK